MQVSKAYLPIKKTTNEDGSFSILVNAAHRPTRRASKPLYERILQDLLVDAETRKGFSLIIYGVFLPKATELDFFPGLTKAEADELGIDHEKRYSEYLNFESSMDRGVMQHLKAVLQICEERMPPILSNSASAVSENTGQKFLDQGYLRFVIPDHLEWFDAKGAPIIQEQALAGPHGGLQATIRLTVGIHTQRNLSQDPKYIWGLSQIRLS